MIRTKAAGVSSLMATAVLSVAISFLPFNFASARPESSTLHDYSSNLVYEEYPGNTTGFSVKILSNADKLIMKAAPSDKKMHFEVEGPSRNQSDNQILNGYFEITMSHSMLGGTYTVLVNNRTLTNVNMTYNKAEAGDQKGDSTTIAFNYDGSTTRSIDILGTTGIPEFPMIGGLAVIASAAASSMAAVIVLTKSLLFRPVNRAV